MNIVKVIKDSLYLSVDSKVRFDKINFWFEERNSEGDWVVCYPKEAYIAKVHQEVRKGCTSTKAMEKIDSNIWNDLKKSTKYCPNPLCRSTALAKFKSINKKVCGVCGTEINWTTDEGQKPLVRNNRLK